MKCDAYLHTLPSKKMHRRKANINETTRRIIKTFDYDICKTEPNIDISNKTIMIKEYQDSFSEVSRNKNPLPIYQNINQQFTREYVNEVIRVLEKEKEELLYKNSSLQASLERIKASFGLQIQELQREIEVINLKKLHQLEQIHNDHQIHSKKLLDEKDHIIFDLKKQIHELKECNDELLINFKEHIRLNKSQTLENKNKFEFLNKEIKEKDEWMNQIENYYESHLDQVMKNSENEKKKLIIN